MGWDGLGWDLWIFFLFFLFSLSLVQVVDYLSIMVYDSM